MKQPWTSIAALWFLWIALGAGASSPSSTRAQTAETGQAKHGTAPADASKTDDPVLARFRGGEITVSEMERAIAQKLLPTRKEIAEPGGRERFLAELVRHDLLAAEAERRGYGKHQAVREAGLRKAVDLLLERAFAVDPASITDQDVAAYYAQHETDFKRPEVRRARHALLATLEEARAAHSAAKEGGSRALAELARVQSKDERTRKQSGELGYFDIEGKPRTGAYVVDPNLAKAVFALEGEGALAPAPIRIEGGYSVVMLLGKIDAVAQSLEQARPAIREKLAAERGEAALQALMKKLEQEVPTEVHAELVSAIELPEARIGERPQGFPAAPPDPRAPPVVVEPDGF